MEAFYSQGFTAIAGVCIFALLLTGLRSKFNILLSFLQRGLIGLLSIAGLNHLFLALAIEASVGVNVWTILVSAILGIPGVCMLFCISMF